MSANQPAADDVAVPDCTCDKVIKSTSCFSKPQTCACCKHPLCPSCKDKVRKCLSCAKVLCATCGAADQCHICTEKAKMAAKISAKQLGEMSDDDVMLVFSSIHLSVIRPTNQRERNGLIIKAMKKLKFPKKDVKEFRQQMQAKKNVAKADSRRGSQQRPSSVEQQQQRGSQQRPPSVEQEREVKPPTTEAAATKKGNSKGSGHKVDATVEPKTSKPDTTHKNVAVKKSKKEKLACSCGRSWSGQSSSKKLAELGCKCCKQVYVCSECRKRCSTCADLVCKACRETTVGHSQLTTRCHRCVEVGQLSGHTLVALAAMPEQEVMDALRRLHQDTERLRDMSHPHKVEELLRVCRMEDKRKTFARNHIQSQMLDQPAKAKMDAQEQTSKEEVHHQAAAQEAMINELKTYKKVPSRYEKETEVPDDWSQEDAGATTIIKPGHHLYMEPFVFKEFDEEPLVMLQPLLDHEAPEMQMPILEAREENLAMRHDSTDSDEPEVSDTKSEVDTAAKVETAQTSDFIAEQQVDEPVVTITATTSTTATTIAETTNKIVSNKSATFPSIQIKKPEPVTAIGKPMVRPMHTRLQEIDDVDVIATLSVPNLKWIMVASGHQANDFVAKEDMVEKVKEIWIARFAAKRSQSAQADALTKIVTGNKSAQQEAEIDSENTQAESKADDAVDAQEAKEEHVVGLDRPEEGDAAATEVGDADELEEPLPPPPPPPPPLCLALGIASAEEISKLPLAEIRKLLADQQVDYKDCLERVDYEVKLLELWNQLNSNSVDHQSDAENDLFDENTERTEEHKIHSTLTKTNSRDVTSESDMDESEINEAINEDKLKKMLVRMVRKKNKDELMDLFKIGKPDEGAAATSVETASDIPLEPPLSPPPPPPPPPLALGIACEEDIAKLGTRQIRELLKEHSVDFDGCYEKQDLVTKLAQLWNDINKHSGDIPEEDRCLICMDARIDCVFLECGHMATCHQCGRQIKDCPVCRTYITRVVRSYRA